MIDKDELKFYFSDVDNFIIPSEKEKFNKFIRTAKKMLYSAEVKALKNKNGFCSDNYKWEIGSDYLLLTSNLKLAEGVERTLFGIRVDVNFYNHEALELWEKVEG